MVTIIVFVIFVGSALLGYGLGQKHTKDVWEIKARHGFSIELGEKKYKFTETND